MLEMDRSGTIDAGHQNNRNPEDTTMPSFHSRFRLGLLLLAGLAPTLAWSESNIEDSAARRKHYAGENEQMKSGHRQIRRWKASFDSLRRSMAQEIYGQAVTRPPVSGGNLAARAQAATPTAAPVPLGTEHSLAGGLIKGKWVLARVNNTTAAGGYGSGVRLDRTTYDSATNTIHALTTEGNLVSAPLVQMGSWRVINHVVQIDRPSFTSIRTPAGVHRLVGIVSGNFQYSDDEGRTWTPSTGGTSSNGGAVWTATLGTGEILAVVTRSSQKVLIRSIDQGATFQDVQAWANAAMAGTRLYNSSDVCFLLRSTGTAVDVYKYASGALAKAGSFASTAKVTSASGTVFSGAIRVYARTDDSTGWSSTDGVSWKQIAGFKDEIQTVNPDKPDVVFSNGPEHQYSSNGGTSWAKYPSNDNTIGWDPKHTEFYKVGGKWTLVAANDMGLCFNDDPLNTKTWRYVNSNHSFAILHGGTAVDNMALTVTSNQDPGTFELTRTARDTFLAKSRYVSDGLRVAATNGGKAYWYRHYWAAFMHAHAASTADTRTTSYDIEGDWYTPPFKGSTKSGEDAIWVSGWDKLVKLTYVASSNSVTRTDLAKDFKTDAGAVTMGIGVAKSDPNRLYVSTKNGRFFWSKDGGQTWTETTYSGTKPTTQWQDWNSASGLYIEVADQNPDLVFWGGGTGAAACLVSRDGGKTFTSTVTGLPSGSEIRNVSIAPDGKLAFSSNYQVWIASANRWYDLRTASMPSGALPAANSLNYLPLQRKVRYFTWGAGVVDLDLTLLNTTDNPEATFDAGTCYQIKSVASGKSLAESPTGNVIQSPFTGATNQTWRLVAQDGFHRVENTGSGKVLQVASASFKEGGLVQTAAWSGADHQQWNVVRAGTNYALSARHSVKALEIASASIADSAKADQGIYVEADHQKWTLLEATNCGSAPVRKTDPSGAVRLASMGKGKFRIEGTENTSVHILVWDRAGRIAWRGPASSELDLSSLGKGVYRIRLWSDHLDATLDATIVP
ncbi:MAG: RICIN domain-containing protein [Fibrobacterota bacterium]|nr:MAG: RICIN domain-containing protein [Fibrobacterota bacterium]